MNYDIEYSKIVRKFLLKHRDLAPKIIEALEQIAQNPYKNSLDIKKLQGTQNCYRLRIAKYRILYEIREQEILMTQTAGAKFINKIKEKKMWQRKDEIEFFEKALNGGFAGEKEY